MTAREVIADLHLPDDIYHERIAEAGADSILSALDKAGYCVIEAELVNRAQRALNDWVVTFADTECSEETVREARARIMNGGGTLAYVADILSAISAHARG